MKPYVRNLAPIKRGMPKTSWPPSHCDTNTEGYALVLGDSNGRVSPRRSHDGCVFQRQRPGGSLAGVIEPVTFQPGVEQGGGVAYSNERCFGHEPW